eukprot:m.116906 g.116906  ORF g.116906 m.116906 type:complete len:53 (+) comp13164_c0_seq2:1442-1600(+)
MYHVDVSLGKRIVVRLSGILPPVTCTPISSIPSFARVIAVVCLRVTLSSVMP